MASADPFIITLSHRTKTIVARGSHPLGRPLGLGKACPSAKSKNIILRNRVETKSYDIVSCFQYINVVQYVTNLNIYNTLYQICLKLQMIS